MHQVVGIYEWPDIVADHPDYLRELKDRIGLNLVILELNRSMGLSPEVAARNPLPVGDERWGPGGIRWSEDDRDVHRAIETCRSLGIDPWVMPWSWYWDAQFFPEFCIHDLAGRSLAEAYPDVRLPFCPSHPLTAEWFELAYVDVARRYADAKAVILTHARYARADFLPGLYTCGCRHCDRAAEELGYNPTAMKAGVARFQQALDRLDPRRLRGADELGLAGADLLAYVGGGPGIVDWINCRADIVSRALARYKRAVQTEASPTMLFGSDTFPPTFSLVCGQRYSDFMTCSDFTVVNLPWFDAHVTSSFAAFGRLLVERAGLSAEEALRLVYRLFGYDGLDLPLDLETLAAGIERESRYITAAARREIEKGRLFNAGAVPSYAWIGGNWPSDAVEALTATSEAVGHEGIVYNRTTSILGYDVPRTKYVS
jgi:hypothetical protein